MTLPSGSREDAERIGRALADEIVYTAYLKHWRAKRRAILGSAAAFLDSHPEASAGRAIGNDEARAARIGRELASQLVLAVSGCGWSRDDERAAIAAAGGRLRSRLKPTDSDEDWSPLIGADRRN